MTNKAEEKEIEISPTRLVMRLISVAHDKALADLDEGIIAKTVLKELIEDLENIPEKWLQDTKT